ncbi:endospore germination permease [Paenibacillus allorhizosphaerae]|uniref:Uncharacterized protein n=1 Tax=Paenibacillus allorhizosphaerae TaxID=2849866 RepID=A0ABN7TLE1_9BACL|nr:endospore germination permease [Paenibacillus allorhizosphaerae]CAG7635965.1 hypothetical protein PAECIP111802_02200 [Paenibacillus allorhizosphaerae]
MDKKIPAILLYSIFMTSVGLSNHVLLIPVLLQLGKRDAWISSAAALIPVLLWVCILYVIVRRVGSDKVTDLIRHRYGKAAGLFVMILIIIYCIENSLVSINDFVTWTNISYLPQTPRFAVMSSFIVLCFFAAYAGIRAIAITSGMLLPLVILLGYLVMGANMQYKDYSLLFPLFTHGYMNSLKDTMLTGGALFELVLIVFLLQHVTSRLRLSSLLLLSFFLIGLTVGPLMGAISIFGPFEAAALRYPAFEQWRMVQMGKYISHLDFFSIYQWVTGAFIRVSLLTYLALDVTGLRKGRLRTVLLAVLCLVFVLLEFVPWNDTMFFDYLLHWHFYGVFAFNLFLTLLLLVMTAFTRNRNKKEADSR